MIGAALLLVAALTLISVRAYLGVGLHGGTWWLGAVVSLYALDQVVDIGLGRSIGRRAQATVLVLIALAVGVDLLTVHNIWGPPLGVLVYVLTVTVVGFVGFCFLLAGLGSVPGCELRAVVYMLASGPDRQTLTHY